MKKTATPAPTGSPAAKWTVAQQEHRLVPPLAIAQGLAAAGLLIAATLAFTRVHTTDLARVSSLPEAIYRSGTLFVVTAQGFPSRQPDAPLTLWYVVAWFCYILSPVVTASIIVEGIRRFRNFVGGPSRVARRLKNHIIICGYGNHGRLFLDRLLQINPHAPAVVIDHDPATPQFIRTANDRLIPVLRRDLTLDVATSLSQANLRFARGLVAATSEDVLNLAICVTATSSGPLEAFRATALVGDHTITDGFRLLINDPRIEPLNTYREAAKRLIAKLEDAHADCLSGKSQPVIVGFGRFGQALALLVAEKIPVDARKGALVCVDLEASRKLRMIESKGWIEQGVCIPCDGNAEDPAVLAKALASSREIKTFGDPVIVLCTDNDASNLRIALQLRDSVGDTVAVLTRMFRRPPQIIDDLLKRNQVRCFELRSLIAEALSDWHR